MEYIVEEHKPEITTSSEPGIYFSYKFREMTFQDECKAWTELQEEENKKMKFPY